MVVSERRWSLQRGSGVLSHYWIRWDRMGVMSSDKTDESLIWSHITSTKVYKTSMLLFFWVIPISVCYAAFQPSFLFQWFNLRARLDAWMLCYKIMLVVVDGLSLAIFRVMWPFVKSAIVSRGVFVRRRDSKHSRAAVCTAKPPRRWCHRSNYNHKNHICVVRFYDYLDFSWKQRRFGSIN